MVRVARKPKKVVVTPAPKKNQARERLTQVSHKLAEQMYKAAQPQSGGPSSGAGHAPGSDGQAKSDDGVVDAEYVDVEDRKAS